MRTPTARRIVEAGRLPANAIEGAEYFEPDMVGVPVPEGAWLSVAGLDLLRHPDGSFGVLEDNLRAPTGLAYAVTARAMVDEHIGYAAPEGREPVERSAYELLGAALRAAAPDGREDPSVVIVADGPQNAAWFEQTEMGARLAVPVVGVSDLSQRGDRLHARVEGSLRPVDVLYRRTDEDRLRDERGDPTPLAELLLPACRAGKLACVNAFGAGIADDKLVHVYVQQLVRFYLGEEPLLPSVRSYDLGVPDVRREALERLGEIVVKPRSESGGAGIVIGPRAEPDELAQVRRAVERDPQSWIAQETVELSHHPTLRDGELVARHVDLRPLIFTGGASVTALTGGLTRVALGEGDMVTNMASNRAVKDTWVIPAQTP